jgi:osmotically-inducible protein OsmY
MSITITKLAVQVETALKADARTSDSAIDVADKNGVIILTGTVALKETLRAAEEIARNQEGVVSVINQLHLDEERETPTTPLVVPPPMAH